MSVATGFESAFIKSWGEWDVSNMVVFHFYNVSLTEQFAKEIGVENSRLQCVHIDLGTMFIAGFNKEGLVFSRKIKLVSS